MKAVELAVPQKGCWRNIAISFIDRVAEVVPAAHDPVALPPIVEERSRFGGLAVTFQDVVVFNDKITDSDLFHGLVRTVQFQILGVQRYSDLLVCSFLRTNAYFAVPLEAHAFALESKFARNGMESFSVEEQVRLWIREGRY